METILAGRVNGGMSISRPLRQQNRSSVAMAALAMAAAAMLPSPAGAERESDPLRFFEGRTEYTSTVKVIARKPYHSRTIGIGEITPDGALYLIQRIDEDGKKTSNRSWRIRQVGPGRFTGTMSDARGPVVVEQVGDRYRFRFKMKGSIAIEQWLTPLPDGRSARSRLTIRKLGVKVGSSDGMIRKVG